MHDDGVGDDDGKDIVICCAEAPYNGDGGDDSYDDIYVVGKP